MLAINYYLIDNTKMKALKIIISRSILFFNRNNSIRMKKLMDRGKANASGLGEGVLS